MARAPIRRLDEAAQNRIAAGEVIERPASAVKELVENAIDAGARRVEVTLSGGGQTLIRVVDDGAGIAADDLALAVERHATSKIDGSDLVNIATLGFRGEALPSIGAVARLAITSRTGDAAAARIDVVAGRIGTVAPAARAPGTTVEVRDLFSATPARLKFLKTPRAETQAVVDMLRRIALAAPGVALRLDEAAGDCARPERTLLDLPTAPGPGPRAAAAAVRFAAIVGAEDAAATVALSGETEVAGGRAILSGRACLPSRARGTAVHQYLTVNGRPVRDRALLGAVRAGYGDFLVRGRHPVFALALDLPPSAVDVNVHPTKAEVRFRDAAAVRALVVGTLRRTLAASQPGQGDRLSARGLAAASRATAPSPASLPGSLPGSFPGSSPGSSPASHPVSSPSSPPGPYLGSSPGSPRGAPAAGPRPAWRAPVPRARRGGEWRPVPAAAAVLWDMPAAEGPAALTEAAPPWPHDPPPDGLAPIPSDDPCPNAAAPGPAVPHTAAPPAARQAGAEAAAPPGPLGQARGQLHTTYIVAETADGLALVDQHAAHERLVLERLKAERAATGVRRQGLLIPEVVSLGPEAALVADAADALATLGLIVEPFGPGTLCVREIPAALGHADPAALLRDVAEELAAEGTTDTLAARLDAVLARIACHGSVRAGRRLDLAEQNALLRAIEATPGAQWCNHGRPTVVLLSRDELEKLFHRR
ncbi:MAG: DNA mismatch repair endonuclease MutL [Pseudomonadota bacterium]